MKAQQNCKKISTYPNRLFALPPPPHFKSSQKQSIHTSVSFFQKQPHLVNSCLGAFYPAPFNCLSCVSCKSLVCLFWIFCCGFKILTLRRFKRKCLMKSKDPSLLYISFIQTSLTDFPCSFFSFPSYFLTGPFLHVLLYLHIYPRTSHHVFQYMQE